MLCIIKFAVCSVQQSVCGVPFDVCIVQYTVCCVLERHISVLCNVHCPGGLHL